MAFDVGLGLDLGALASGTMNYKAQKKNLQYQKRLQREIFAREDNAHQRAVKDLRAAGLSPTLAAGAAAQAGSVVKTDAPSLELGDTGKMQANADALGLLTMRKNIEKVGLENELLKSKRVEADASTLDHKAGAYKKSVEAERTKYDTGIAKESGQETNPGPLLRTTRNIATTLNAAWRNQAKNVVSVDEEKKRGDERRDKLNKVLMGTGYKPKHK